MIWQHDRMIEEIDRLSSDYILNTSVDKLAEYFHSTYSFEIIVLKHDETHIHEHGEVQIDVRNDPTRSINDRSQPVFVRGTFVIFAVPFTGNPNLFSYTPSTLDFNSPYADIVDSEIHAQCESTKQNADEVKSRFTYTIGKIAHYLSWINKDLISFNQRVESVSRQHIDWRRDKILKDSSMVASLGFPLKKRHDNIKTFSTPLVRKKITLPSPETKKVSAPEPTLLMEDYEAVLNLIQDMALVIERSPKAFSNMGE